MAPLQGSNKINGGTFTLFLTLKKHVSPARAEHRMIHKSTFQLQNCPTETDDTENFPFESSLIK